MAAPTNLSPRMVMPVPVRPVISVRPPPLVGVSSLRPMVGPFPQPPTTGSPALSSPQSADKTKQPSRRVCLDYVKGKCQRTQCRFLHPDLGHVQHRFQDVFGGGGGGGPGAEVCEVFILTSPTVIGVTRGESSCGAASPLLAHCPPDQIFLDILQDLRLKSW
jgi:hypothetical protein